MDITPHHFVVINLESWGPVPLEELVLVHYLPPRSWEHEPTINHSEQQSFSSQVSSETLSNGAAIPSHEVYYTRKKELCLDKADVYKFLRQENPKNIKIVHFRKFWIFLKQVGEYWDVSLDHYLDDDTADAATTGNNSTAPNAHSDDRSDALHPTASMI